MKNYFCNLWSFFIILSSLLTISKGSDDLFLTVLKNMLKTEVLISDSRLSNFNQKEETNSEKEFNELEESEDAVVDQFCYISVMGQLVTYLDEFALKSSFYKEIIIQEIAPPPRLFLS